MNIDDKIHATSEPNWCGSRFATRLQQLDKKPYGLGERVNSIITYDRLVTAVEITQDVFGGGADMAEIMIVFQALVRANEPCG
jgi:hypothetical protein